MEKHKKIIDHKRLIDVLDNYFSEITKKSGGLAAESEIDINALSNIADDCFLARVDDDPVKLVYLGKNLINAFGDDFFSRDVTKLFLPSNHKVAERFQWVVDTAQSHYVESIFKNKVGMNIKYRMKIYPLTDKPNRLIVNYIFGGMRWKVE